jgi:hypothetical protein
LLPPCFLNFFLPLPEFRPDVFWGFFFAAQADSTPPPLTSEASLHFVRVAIATLGNNDPLGRRAARRRTPPPPSLAWGLALPVAAGALGRRFLAT